MSEANRLDAVVRRENGGNVHTIFGMKVVEHPLLPDTRPRMQLSKNVPVSDEFRVSFNAWLEDFFGHEAVVFIISGRTIAAAPKNVAMLRMQLPPNDQREPLA